MAKDPGPEARGGSANGAPAEPRRFGHFSLLKELGRGAQGVVHLAEDNVLHRKVALKMLAGAGAQSDEVRDRFQREATIASRLHHPGICGVHEMGEVDGVPFIAMQYLRGETLRGLVDDSRAPVADGDGATPGAELVEVGASVSLRAGSDMQDVVRLIERAARALHVAHDAGLVHRDIKPANIMVTPEGEPVLLDFGLARDLDSHDQTLTQSGQIMGTPAYLSPEQIRGARDGVDRRTDIYGLGVTLYECLTLQRPFEASSWEELFDKIFHAEAPNPRRLNPRIPRDLRTVIETAMDREPGRRYQTALEFAEDLRHVRSFEPIRAKAAGPITRARKWARRHPARSAVIAAALVVGLTGCGWLVGQRIAHARAVHGYLASANDRLARADFQGALEEIARASERDSAAAERKGAPELRARIERERDRAAREARRAADLQAAADARRESSEQQEAHAQLGATILELEHRLDVERATAFGEYASDEVRGSFARAERELQSRRVEAERSLQQAREALQRAARLEAPWGGNSEETEAALADFHMRLWRAARADDDVARTTWLGSAVERHDSMGRHTAELRGLGALTASVEPQDAELYLFRFEPYEELSPGTPIPRLVPVPTAPTGTRAVGPWWDDFRPGDFCLEIHGIEPASPAGEGGLRPGDLVLLVNGAPCDRGLFVSGPAQAADQESLPPGARIQSINGVAVEARFDWSFAPPPPPGETDRVALASSTEALPIDRESVPCATARQLLAGPAPAELLLTCLQAGTLVELRIPPGTNSGITGEITAYPLICSPENSIAPGQPLEIDPGSYLVLGRREGFETQRLPVLVPRGGELSAVVELLPSGTTPPGFRHIPPGAFRFQGDELAFRPEPGRTLELDGFFIAELELSNAAWFEFVNDPATLAEIEASEARIYLPREPSKILVEERDGGGYTWMRGSAETPVYGISWNDVRGYLVWRNRRAREAGEPYHYDLPTQAEWEKAARGADGRPFPWGARFDFALVVSTFRKWDWLLDAPGGFEPRDRSVYGVADLAGSRREFTRDAVADMDPPAYYTRGGWWGQSSELGFRAASRAFANADYSGGDTGVRLVLRPHASPPPADGDAGQ